MAKSGNRGRMEGGGRRREAGGGYAKSAQRTAPKVCPAKCTTSSTDDTLRHSGRRWTSPAFHLVIFYVGRALSSEAMMSLLLTWAALSLASLLGLTFSASWGACAVRLAGCCRAPSSSWRRASRLPWWRCGRRASGSCVCEGSSFSCLSSFSVLRCS
ncbi:hypothetical protein B0H11DRAFT_2093258 [Mycena galericulata]|nr:hypothetical protein B0H11DRAFT_2093258 [Mycena galericulata]